jgi:protein phosphatase
MAQQAASPPLDPRHVGAASVAGRRAANEDAWGAAPALGDPAEFYVVADGVGGQERGDLASRAAVAAAVRAFQERRAAGDEAATALRAAVEAANREVYELARRMGVERMGCTLVAATLAAGRLDVAHVGDARAYLLKGSSLYPLTKDHTWVQEQVDRGTIAPEDAARHEFRHIVQRVLGNEAAVEATLGGPFAVGRGDRLILTTDGVHDVVSDARLAQLAAGAAPQAAAEVLVNEALAAGSEDNVTALVVAVGVDAVAVAPRVGAASGRAITERLEVNRPITGQGRVMPAAAPSRRRLGVAPVLLLVALVLGGLFALSRRDGGAPAPTPAPTDGSPRLATAPAVESGRPPATSTAALTGTPGPDEATPPAAGSSGAQNIICLQQSDPIFLFTDDLVEDSSLCGEFAPIQIEDSNVELLSPTGQTTKFLTDLRGGGCGELDFIQVRSLDASYEGWIFASHEDTCQQRDLTGRRTPDAG